MKRRCALIGWLCLLLFLAACTDSSVPAATAQPTPRPTSTPLPAPEGWIAATVPITLDTVQNLTGLGSLDAPEPPTTIFAYALSLDGAMLAGLNNDFMLVWDLISGDLLTVIGRNSINAVMFAPDRSTIYTLTNDGHITVYDARTGTRIDTQGAFSEYNAIWGYDPVGGWLALGSEDGSVQIWDMPAASSDVVLDMEPAPVTALAFNPAGTALAAGTAAGYVELWAHETGEQLGRVQVPGRVLNVAFSPSGAVLAVNTTRGVVLLNPTTAQIVTTMTQIQHPGVFGFLGQSEFLALGGEESDVTLWDTSTGSLAATLPGTQGSRPSVAASPQADMLLTSTRAGSSLWNISQLKNGTVLRGSATLPQTDLIRGVWTPDGLQILAFEAIGSLRVYGIP